MNGKSIIFLKYGLGNRLFILDFHIVPVKPISSIAQFGTHIILFIPGPTVNVSVYCENQALILCCNQSSVPEEKFVSTCTTIGYSFLFSRPPFSADLKTKDINYLRTTGLVFRVFTAMSR